MMSDAYVESHNKSFEIFFLLVLYFLFTWYPCE